MTTPTLAYVPLEKIEVTEGYNIREDIDLDQSFIASVRSNGVTTPIELRENGGDKYNLVSGHRRFAAAQIAKLKTIPAIIQKLDDADALVHTFIENVHRKDLTPYEEAVGIARMRAAGITSRKAISTQTGLTEKQVKDREDIAKLPEELGRKIGEGIPVAMLDVFTNVAKVTPAGAVALSEYVIDTHIPTSGLENHLGDYIANSIEDDDNIDIEEWGPQKVWQLAEFDFGEELNKLVAGYDEAKKPRKLAFRISEETRDAGVATGTVLFCKGGYQGSSWFICSTEWTTDVFKTVLERAEVQQEIADAIEGKDTGEADTPENPVVIDSDERSWEEKEAERKQSESAERKNDREQSKQDKERADAYNSEFAKQLFERVKVEKADTTNIGALIALAVNAQGAEWALKGLRYLHPGWTYEDTTDTGKKVTRLVDREAEAKKRLNEFLKAPTVEGQLTKFAQLLVASYAADERAVARTRRVGHAPNVTFPDGPTKVGKLFRSLRNKLTPSMRDSVDSVMERDKTARFEESGAALGVSTTDD